MRAIVFGWVWPEPNSSAAGRRIIQIIEVLHEMNFEIHFACAAQKSEYSYKWNFPVIEKQININSSEIDDWLKNLEPNIVLFDRVNAEEYYAWKVAKYCPEALRILDCEDIQTLRIARQKAIKNNEAFDISKIYQEPFALREIASIKRSHLSLIISPFEMQLLKNEFKINDNILFNFPLLAEEKREGLNFKERKDFVWIGNFKHPPNKDATLYLKKVIWPLIRALKPQATLNVYGAYPSQEILQLNNPKEGFMVHGRAKDALEIIEQSRVLIAPIRFGAGQKGKLLDAMLTNTPSVTSIIGAEGMHTMNQWPGFICDNPEDFATKAIQLYFNEDSWLIAQNKIKTILDTNFNKEHHQTKLKQILHKNSKKDQLINFEQKLIIHHSFKNAEYMSKWIELKEANLSK